MTNLTLRQQLLGTYLLAGLISFLIIIVAISNRYRIIETAALDEATQVANVMAYTITEPVLLFGASLFENPQTLQNYVTNIYNVQQRDIEVIRNDWTIIADVAADEVGQTFEDDSPDQAVAKTMADGQIRTFVEVSDDYPEGIRQLITPIFLSGSTVPDGVLLIEYTKLYNSLVDQSSSALLVLILIGVVSLGIALLIAYFIPRYFSNLVERLSEAVVTIAQGGWRSNFDLEANIDLGSLRRSFDQMAAAISDRDRKLEEAARALEAQIKEAHEAREQAERADRVKSAFLASMSHELRTPLNSVINYTKFVLKGMMGEVTPRQTETLTKVVDSSFHLLALINDVLDMSKIEAGALNLFIEDNIDVGGIIRAAADATKPMLEGKPVEMVVKIEPDLPLIRADRQRVRQIILNVLSNACKFTESGSITVEARREGEQLRISIQDTGVGIAAEDTNKVFVPFKQTDSGLRKGSGTGLGMPISASLAEAHGGKLWFESEVGHGSTFFLRLPLQAAVEMSSITSTSDKLRTANLRPVTGPLSAPQTTKPSAEPR
ncbi:MAG: HAMP domain-containing sensor histidine kinase [Anaerolineae bacterium]